MTALFGFRHVLVQEAVYRSAPKRLRAELHERYADRLDTESPDLPDLDEFVGYHLEQAYRYGRSSASRIAERSSWPRTPGAGSARRAFAPRSAATCPRAIGLLRSCDVDPSVRATHGSASSCASSVSRCVRRATSSRLLDGARGAHRSVAVACARSARRGARSDGARVRSPSVERQERQATHLLDATAAAIPVFEAAGDDRCARAGRGSSPAGCTAVGAANTRSREDAAERALDYYRALDVADVDVPPARSRTPSIYGPTPRADGDRSVRRASSRQRLRPIRPRERRRVSGRPRRPDGVTSSDAQRSDRVSKGDITKSSGIEAVGSDVQRLRSGPTSQLLADDARRGGGHASAGCVPSSSRRERTATSRAEPATSRRRCIRQGQLDEAAEWTAVARERTRPPTISMHSCCGCPCAPSSTLGAERLDEARSAWRPNAVRLAETTDALNRHAKAQSDLARGSAARRSTRRCTCGIRRGRLQLFEAKGNVVRAAASRASCSTTLALV